MKLLSSTRWQCLFDFRMFDASNLTVISGSGRFGWLVVVVFLREQKKKKQIKQNTGTISCFWLPGIPHSDSPGKDALAHTCK